MCIIQYISLYVTQGLSSRLHIGRRHHPNRLFEVHVILKGVAISGELFVTNNGYILT